MRRFGLAGLDGVDELFQHNSFDMRVSCRKQVVLAIVEGMVRVLTFLNTMSQPGRYRAQQALLAVTERRQVKLRIEEVSFIAEPGDDRVQLRQGSAGPLAEILQQRERPQIFKLAPIFSQ